MRKGTILLATMSETGTIDAVLQEIAESVHSLERFHFDLNFSLSKTDLTVHSPFYVKN
jgi:hypothetical protein